MFITHPIGWSANYHTCITACHLILDGCRFFWYYSHNGMWGRPITTFINKAYLKLGYTLSIPQLNIDSAYLMRQITLQLFLHNDTLYPLYFLQTILLVNLVILYLSLQTQCWWCFLLRNLISRRPAYFFCICKQLNFRDHTSYLCCNADKETLTVKAIEQSTLGLLYQISVIFYYAPVVRCSRVQDTLCQCLKTQQDTAICLHGYKSSCKDILRKCHG